ncbi:MAG: hypothetical protein M1820_009507 [Bogoriella megaspora]|nr:MAG: hypothetical protein M1820_009507 [Bogoriella megaspora]
MSLPSRPKLDSQRPPILVLDLKPEAILNDQDEDHVESQLGDCALEFALLGDVESARQLDSILWTSALVLPTARKPILKFAWVENGKWPDGFPEDEKRESSLAELDREYGFIWAHNADPEHAMPSFDEEGMKKLLDKKDKSFAYFRRGWLGDSEELVRALEISESLHPTVGVRDLERLPGQESDYEGALLEETEYNRRDRVRLSNLNGQSRSIVKDLVASWGPRNRGLWENLARSGPLWPLFVRGLLADALGVGQDELRTRGKILTDAFKERMQNPGGSSSLSSLPMKELVELADKNTLHGAGKAQWLEVHFSFKDPPKTLMRNPASEEDISKLEARLDITLPDDFKEFLRITNGYGRDNMVTLGGDKFIHDVEGLFNGYYDDPGIYGVDDLQWEEDEVFQRPAEMLFLPMRFGEDLVPAQKHSGLYPWNSPYPLSKRRLRLGRSDVHALYLVEPSVVKEARDVYLKMYEAADSEQKRVLDRAIAVFAGSMEEFMKVDWLFLSGQDDHERAHSSFRKYLEYTAIRSQGDSLLDA